MCGLPPLLADLQGKVESLRALLALAQEREGAARGELAALEEQRAQALATTAAAAPPLPFPVAGGSGGQPASGSGAEEPAARRAAALQKFHRLSQLCAAADQSLRLMARRLAVAVGPSSGARGLGRRSVGAQRRSSVAGGTRRTSIGPPRRMSAAGLAQQRGAAARASIAAGTSLPPLSIAAPPGRAAPQGSALTDPEFFPHLPGLLAEVGGGLGTVAALTRQLEAANAALQQLHAAPAPEQQPTAAPPAGPSSAAAGIAGAQSGGSELPTGGQPAHAAEATAGQAVHLAAGGTSGATQAAGAPRPNDSPQGCMGYKRATLSGPAWLDGIAKPSAPPQRVGPSPKPSPAAAAGAVAEGSGPRRSLRASFASSCDSGSGGGLAASKCAAREAVLALERLVGHAAEPSPPADDDPFAALTSDDDDSAVMDRRVRPCGMRVGAACRLDAASHEITGKCSECMWAESQRKAAQTES